MSARADHGHLPSLDRLLAGFVDRAPARPISGLSRDSRGLQAGSVFVALAGARHHGLDFIDGALAAGVAAVLAEESDPRFDGAMRTRIVAAGAEAIAVPRLAEVLGLIATRFYVEPASDLACIGITGTDGKTTVSQFVAAAYDRPGARCGVIGTLGNGLPGALEDSEFTTPDAIGLQASLAAIRDAGAISLAMEVSSHGLALQRVAGMPFEIAVLTNLGRDHLDFHGSLAAYREAKMQLFQWPGLRARVLNLDDPFGRELLAAPRADVRDLSYSANGDAAADFAAEAIECRDEGLRFTLRTTRGQWPVKTALLGRFNVDNLLATAATLATCGMEDEEIVAELSVLQSVPGRLERFYASGAASVVVDYAHTPQALSAALLALRPHCAGKLWCLFGCGGDRDRGKRAEMAAAAEHAADRVIVSDDNPRSEDPEFIVADILGGFAHPEVVWVERDRGTAIRRALAEAEAEDWILVAGKGHEDYQIVGQQRLDYSDRDTVRAALQEPPR